jgi:hypothetical protein
MDSRRLELQQDLSEVDKLLSRSTRDFVKQVLVQERLKISTELNQILSSSPKPISSHSTIEKSWKSIDKFSWDQSRDKVKIFVTCLENFDSVSEKDVKLEFAKDQLTVSITGFQGADYRFKVMNLAGEITDARLSKKSNGFLVTLKKKEILSWKKLTGKGNLTQHEEVQVSGSEKDVSQELMKLYQELYRDGDEEMKKLLSPAVQKVN